MKTGLRVIVAAFCVCTLAASAAVFAQAKDEKKPTGDKPAAKPPEAKPTAKPGDKPAAGADKGGAPGADDMMKLMQEMSAPGKEHEALKPMIGSFSCTTKFWMQPGTPPEESTATAERKWILGGRYMAEEVKGTAMKIPFEGFSITGYDKLQKFYHSYWVDSMGTGMWSMTGTADASGKTFTFTGENFDPMTMTKKKGRSTTEIINNDKHVMKMFDTGPDGKEWMPMEIACTRK